MNYRFRLLHETLWAVLITAIVALCMELMVVDFNAIEDWRIWATAIAGGVVRPVAAAIVSKLSGELIVQRT